MREERIDNQGVPTRLYEPVNADGLLLFGHGGGHSKDTENFVRLCRLYAEQTGLAVVCIDAVDHGERKTRELARTCHRGGIRGRPIRW